MIDVIDKPVGKVGAVNESQAGLAVTSRLDMAIPIVSICGLKEYDIEQSPRKAKRRINNTIFFI